MTSRTLASLHKTSQQYTGILMKADLHVQPQSEQQLLAWISRAEYAQLQMALDEESEVPEDNLEYQPLKLNKQPFMIKLKDGVVSIAQ